MAGRAALWLQQRSFSWSARDRPLAVRPARQNSGLWPGAPSGMPVPALALGPHTLVPVWGTIMDGAPPYPNGFGQPYPAESPGEPSLDDAKSSLGDAESSLGDAKSSLGDAKSWLGDA
jgi:hypothetical protein